MKNIIKTIGNANANALTFNVIVKQKSISTKNGIELESNFKAKFEVNVNRYFTIGQTLSRIVKALNFQIVQGKQSGKLKGLNLKFPFMFSVECDGKLIFQSQSDEYNAKGGVTEKAQNKFFHNVSKQYVLSYLERTELYVNYGDENDSLYTTEKDSELYREALNENVCEAIEMF